MSAAEAFAPMDARGETFWLSRHAAARALDMGVPLQLVPTILSTGTIHDAPSRSKYQGRYAIRAGKVALMIEPSMEGPIIVTILWTTVEAWRSAEEKAGREYKGDDWTAYNLESWFGGEAS